MGGGSWTAQCGGGRGEERHKQRAAEGWPVVKNFSGSTQVKKWVTNQEHLITVNVMELAGLCPPQNS